MPRPAAAAPGIASPDACRRLCLDTLDGARDRRVERDPVLYDGGDGGGNGSGAGGGALCLVIGPSSNFLFFPTKNSNSRPHRGTWHRSQRRRGVAFETP